MVGGSEEGGGREGSQSSLALFHFLGRQKPEDSELGVSLSLHRETLSPKLNSNSRAMLPSRGWNSRTAEKNHTGAGRGLSLSRG